MIAALFFLYFYVYSFDNQYIQEWKMITMFPDLEYIIFGWNYNEECTDRHENSHEFYQMPCKTKSMVSIDENLGIKFIVSILWNFTIVFHTLVFNGHQSNMFINKKLRQDLVFIKQGGTSTDNRCLGHRKWTFSDPISFNFQNEIFFLIIHYCVQIQWSISR